MIRVADFIAQTLADRGVRHIFLVTGGGAMFLNNAFGQESRIQVICNHHEQACAMAAEAYARISGELGVINVTSGPGGINALNGVFGAYTDSVPMLIVSGQVKRETCMANYSLPGLRQLGDQEVDIVRMVQGITKYAVLVTDPQSIRYHLEKAMWLAMHGRPGPCWLDIPVDVQSSQIDPGSLRGFHPEEQAPDWSLVRIQEQCREVAERLGRAKRPVLLAGTGIRAGRAMEPFCRVVRQLGIPVATAWVPDLLSIDDPHYCGRQGTIGDRAGNFTVQNADLLLIIGARMPIRQISYNWKSFARHAFKIQVDIDPAELAKPFVGIDLPIVCDAGVFLSELERGLQAINYAPQRHAEWLAWCKERLRRYPVVQAKHRSTANGINPYGFIETLWRNLADDDVVACGDATACIVTFQGAAIRGEQRVFSNSGSASMGYDLPAAIGAAVSRDGKRVICLAGDGSIQMNVQELQTVVQHRWPIKIFVLNNGGYLSIRQTQATFFGRLVGEGPESGVSFPNMVKIAEAYGLPTFRIEGTEYAVPLKEMLAHPGPALGEVMLDRGQMFEPKLSSKQLPDGRMVTAPLEDMFPFLAPAELKSNMLIPPIE